MRTIVPLLLAAVSALSLSCSKEEPAASRGEGNAGEVARDREEIQSERQRRRERLERDREIYRARLEQSADEYKKAIEEETEESP